MRASTPVVRDTLRHKAACMPERKSRQCDTCTHRLHTHSHASESHLHVTAGHTDTGQFERSAWTRLQATHVRVLTFSALSFGACWLSL